jgi:tRNA threonylcarbamoyladenosine biosynthesis protein TsaB
MKIIDEQFKMANLSMEMIDKIFVVTGPGSFTGIRIGLTIAKVIAWSLNKPIIPLSSLELLATTCNDAEYVVPYIDAHHECVYAGIYDQNLNNVLNDNYMTVDDLLKNLSSNKKYLGISYDNVIKTLPTINPNVDIVKIISKHKDDVGISAHEIKPNYLKLTEAEVNKNGNN